MTRTSKINFTPGTSDEVRAAIEPHLLKWEFLIPAWCHEVNVTWKDDDLNGALNIVVHYEYRRADVTICPNFMSIPHRRERNVVHELLHIVTHPIVNTARDIRDRIDKTNPSLADWANEMIRHSDESVACDLTAVLMGRLDGER
jgi:hypothetical protein